MELKKIDYKLGEIAAEILQFSKETNTAFVLVVWELDGPFSRAIGNGEIVKTIAELKEAAKFLSDQLEKISDGQLAN